MTISANVVSFQSSWDINRVKLVVEQHVGTGVNIVTHDNEDTTFFYKVECAGHNVSVSQVRKMMRKLEAIKYLTTIGVYTDG